MEVTLFNGELNSFHFKIYLKSEIPEMTNVLIGPTEIALTLIFFFPRSTDKYFTLVSKATLQFP